jgi:flagellar protein FlgJ
MSIDAVTNHTAASAAATIEYGAQASFSKPGRSRSDTPTPEDIKKASAQFEAIIMRQLIGPSIEPIMSGGLGGGKSPGGSAGAGVYGQMMTEVLADKLAQGGGLGLGKMLEQQLGGHTSHPLSSKSLLKPSTSSTQPL